MCGTEDKQTASNTCHTHTSICALDLHEPTCPFPSSGTSVAGPPAPKTPSGAGPVGHPAWCDATRHAAYQSALARGERGEEGGGGGRGRGEAGRKRISDTGSPPSASDNTKHTHRHTHSHIHTYIHTYVRTCIHTYDHTSTTDSNHQTVSHCSTGPPSCPSAGGQVSRYRPSVSQGSSVQGTAVPCVVSHQQGLAASQPCRGGGGGMQSVNYWTGWEGLITTVSQSQTGDFWFFIS